MHQLSSARLARATLFVILASVTATASAQTALRVVTYNIDADTADFETNGVPIDDNSGSPALTTVLQAIGAEKLGGGPITGKARPIDIISINEAFKTPATTLAAIAGDLNSIYHTTTYTYDATVPAGTTVTGTGNGPSGIVYNSATVVDEDAVGLAVQDGTAGVSRVPMRYTLQPVALQSDPRSTFYLYVDHYKAAGDAQSVARRTNESVIVRQDADSLGAGAHIIYAGDFNFTNGSSEDAYQNLVAAPGTTLASNNITKSGSTVTITPTTAGAAGPAQAYDPANPTNNYNNTVAFRQLYTDASGIKPGNTSGGLTSRLDFQLVSTPVVDPNQPGLELIPNTYTSFGNDTYAGSLDTSTITSGRPVNFTSNITALTDLPNRTDVLSALAATFTDHLPVVADYSFASLSVPEPTSLGVVFIAALTLKRRRRQ